MKSGAGRRLSTLINKKITMRSTNSGQRAIYLLGGAALLLSLLLTPPAGSKPDAKTVTGEQVYQRQCASCHGKKGAGAAGYPSPLTGKKSVGELGRFISQQMPPGKKHCPAPDAQRVAAYIFDAFYSPLAQARNKPARVALSRLTVRQFRNAVADLVGDFHPVVPAGAKRGLHGEYFKGRDFDTKERVIDRVDSQVRFDFGTDGPTPSQFDPHHFSASWEGSVLAPDTGEYEFIVRTEHGGRLWVNGDKQALIDASIKSGNGTEYRGVITLLGGRAYPLRLEFAKGTVGVDDSDKKKGKPAPPASIALLWRRPKMAPETIPQRCLFPVSVPETFVVAARFPPDDRSVGYERGISVSKAWDDAATAAALETAGYVAAHLSALSGVKDDAPDRKIRLQTVCRSFVERAFRHPLTPEIENIYVTKQFRATNDLNFAVKRVVALTLKSPRFLYREINADPKDPYNVASRLSFGLWDTLPDSELLKAASSGALVTPEQTARQAERMANDPRAWNKMREFLLAYLKVDETRDLVKSAKQYPDFDASIASDLRTSLELFLENMVWSEKSDYRELMMTKTQFLNGRLAKMYGANLPADAPFQPVTLDAAERSGVLTNPYLLSNFAYMDGSSPIHRGVLIARSLLGVTLRPPPAAFVPLPANLHPDLTTRQRVALQTRPTMCASCHGTINPLGFTLEKFDAIGRLRLEDNGKSVDATGSYLARDGKLIKFANAPDLGRYLATSEDAHAAFVEKLFHHLVKQPVLAYGSATLPNLERSFARNGYNMRKLMVEIVASSALSTAASPNPTPKRIAGTN